MTEERPESEQVCVDCFKPVGFLLAQRSLDPFGGKYIGKKQSVGPGDLRARSFDLACATS